MTAARDIMTKEGLEREFRSIRQVFIDLSEEEKPLRIEWGTRKAMEEAEKPVKPVEVIAPKSYKIDAKELEDGRWQLHYEEGFDPKFYNAFKLGATALQSLGAAIKIESDRIIVDLTAHRDKVLNTLAGEFFAVSEAGRLSLSELFVMLSLKAEGL